MTSLKLICITGDNSSNRKLVETLLRTGGREVSGVESVRASLDVVMADPQEVKLL